MVFNATFNNILSIGTPESSRVECTLFCNLQSLARTHDLPHSRPVALFTKILTIKNCRKCKTKIKKSFTKILTIILSVKIVLTLRVKLPCPKCKILIVREILVLSFIVSEKNRKKDGRCIGAST